MPDSHSAARFSSGLRENFRKNRALWWIGGAAILVVLGVMMWLKWRGRISFSVLREWITHPPTWSMPLGFAAAALFALVILWKVPQWQVRDVEGLDAKERFDRVNEARKTLATILGGAAFLVGGFFTWQNIKVAQDAASTSQKALEVSREGQVTDRFSKAIDQLGAVDSNGKPRMVVRLGGIYALEGIANESAELHWPIMEVLCTYVRENAPVNMKEVLHGEKASSGLHAPADIQAIITVLGRRNGGSERNDQRLYLVQTNLSLVDMQHLDFSGTWLLNADLRGATLLGADLRRTKFFAANLSGALLIGANLSGAYLAEAILVGADLNGADLNGADLSGADLRRTKGLTQEQIDAANGDSTTLLPENLHQPDSWKK